MGIAALFGMYNAIAMRSNAERTLFGANEARLGLANGAALDNTTYVGNPFAGLGPRFGGSDSPMMQLYQQDRSLALRAAQASIQLAYANAMQDYYQKGVKEWGKSFNTFNA